MSTIQERVDEYRAKVNEKLEGLPEAGAICYGNVFAGGFAINLTQRANNVYDAYVAFKMGVDLLGEVFGVTLEKDIKIAAPPKPSKKVDPVDAEFPEPVYEDVKGETEVTHANSIKILPQPDDRVNLEFYEDGKKWPVIKVTKWKTKQVQELLEKVTSEDVSKPAEVKVDCAVLWTQGSEYNYNGKTGFYKDVCGVEPA